MGENEISKAGGKRIPVLDQNELLLENHAEIWRLCGAHRRQKGKREQGRTEEKREARHSRILDELHGGQYRGIPHEPLSKSPTRRAKVRTRGAPKSIAARIGSIR